MSVVRAEQHKVRERRKKKRTTIFEFHSLYLLYTGGFCHRALLRPSPTSLGEESRTSERQGAPFLPFYSSFETYTDLIFLRSFSLRVVREKNFYSTICSFTWPQRRMRRKKCRIRGTGVARCTTRSRALHPLTHTMKYTRRIYCVRTSRTHRSCSEVCKPL